MAKPQDVRAGELSPAARKAVTLKLVRGRKRLNEWRELLDELARFDSATDQLQSRAGKFAIGGIVLLAVGGFITLFTSIVAAGGGLPVFVPILAAALPIGGLVLLVYNGLRWSYYRKVDLANDFRVCIAPLLELLGHDLPPRGRVGLSLDLTGVTKEKLVSTEKIPPGRFNKVIERVYEDPWCHLAATLADGSKMVLDITNRPVSYDRYWTTRRGAKTKSKHKRKWKKLVLVTAALLPDAGKLAWDDGEVDAAATQEKIKLAEKKGTQVCRLVRKFKFASVGNAPEETISHEDILRMYMKLYSMLAPAGAGS